MRRPLPRDGIPSSEDRAVSNSAHTVVPRAAGCSFHREVKRSLRALAGLSTPLFNATLLRRVRRRKRLFFPSTARCARQTPPPILQPFPKPMIRLSVCFQSLQQQPRSQSERQLSGKFSRRTGVISFLPSHQRSTLHSAITIFPDERRTLGVCREGKRERFLSSDDRAARTNFGSRENRSHDYTTNFRSDSFGFTRLLARVDCIAALAKK